MKAKKHAEKLERKLKEAKLADEREKKVSKAEKDVAKEANTTIKKRKMFERSWHRLGCSNLKYFV